MHHRSPRRIPEKRHPGHHRIILARGEHIRTIAIRPWIAGVALGCILLLSGGYIAATAYLFFRDDILAASLAQQARMRHAYEDRLAELRGRIDRITSRQVLNQEALDAKLRSLAGRQQALDQRQTLLADLGAAAKRAGLDLVPVTVAAPKGDRLTTESVPAPQPRASLDVPDEALRTSSIDVSSIASPARNLGDVEAALKDIESEQLRIIGAVADRAQNKSQKIAAVIGKLGHGAIAKKAASGIGGPYVPVNAKKGVDPFMDGVSLAASRISTLAAMSDLARRLPIRQPISESEITSDYGVRLDPFLKRPSMHTGIDFRAGLGEAVAAAAPGKVIIASQQGGYGNMVEIDHGDGITTRYAHLSKISVEEGQKVSAGTIVGRTGDTGRSTGPHLHYEVRIDGDPVDPMRYIKAARELRGLI